LSPAFVEWMMDVSPGWVTAVPDLSRDAMLKILGNGVVPRHGALGLRLLAGRAGLLEPQPLQAIPA
jgi:DNA (cytosine-5)-methyltransferase 1